MNKLGTLLLCSALALGGCTTMTERTSQDETQLESDALAESEIQRQTFDWPNVFDLHDQPSDVWSQLAGDFRFASVEHPAIDRFMDELTRKPESLEARLERCRPYLFHVSQELRNREMPGELALLPVIESSYMPTARSSQGAVGLWQFMPETGRDFGLQQDWWMDQRRDPLASTDAALTYLQTLNQQFEGDWLLTLAAYNAGPLTVTNAIKKNTSRHKPTDYWSLDLPPETKKYVPRLLALARVTMQSDQLELELPEIKNEPYFERVEIQGSLDLGKISQLAGANPEEVAALNAGLKQKITPPNEKVQLLLPKETVARFEQEYANLPSDERIDWDRYQVKKGDTLVKLAKQYGLEANQLKQVNGLKASSVKPGQYLMIPLDPKLIASRQFDTPESKARKTHQVRKGDSLYGIASKYKVSVKQLVQWNELKSNSLKPGQQLLVMKDNS